MQLVLQCQIVQMLLETAPVLIAHVHVLQDIKSPVITQHAQGAKWETPLALFHLTVQQQLETVLVTTTPACVTVDTMSVLTIQLAQDAKLEMPPV